MGSQVDDSPAKGRYDFALDDVKLGAKALQMTHGQMRPSDMLMMTLRAQEFLFHCEMTSNVANRTSEGVQQLFREQS